MHNGMADDNDRQRYDAATAFTPPMWPVNEPLGDEMSDNRGTH